MNYFKNKQKAAKRQFTIAWIILTAVFFVTLLLFEKIQYEDNRRNQLAMAVEDYRFKLDSLFNRLLLPASFLSLHADCKKILKPQLEKIDFQNPLISGIVISDKTNHILCTTTHYEQTLPFPSPHDPSLIGPLHERVGDRGIYLLQKQIDDHYYGVYLLGRIISREAYKNPEIKAFALKDIKLNNIIYQQDNFDPSGEQIISTPIEKVANLALIVIPNKDQWRAAFLLKELLLLLSLLLLSTLLYFYIRKRIIDRFSLTTALESALQKKHFKPYYMPTWDEKLKRFTGAEVLIRWHFRDGDIIPPDLFIQEAETSGLIVPMTLELIKICLKECKHYFRSDPKFYLSFNLSLDHFNEPGFFEAVYRLFRECRIQPSQIMFELTERQLLNEKDDALKNHLYELIHCGCSLAIDDFGTGHASINYLRHFPFTHLKIDKIFIQAIGTGAIIETLSYSIIQLAKTNKYSIIAEGVETEAQYHYLKKHKVTAMQGWFFSKAIHFEHFNALMKEQEERIQKENDEKKQS